jgi:hypothetical protein
MSPRGARNGAGLPQFNSHAPQPKPHGRLRRAQVVQTFGPGAMLDLPEYSVLVSGLEHWRGVDQEIQEPRLAAKLSMLLDGMPVVLKAPPAAGDDVAPMATGIRVWQFPEWFVTRDLDVDGAGDRSRLLLHRRHLQKGRFLDRERKKRPVVPIRFVRACRRGHIGDIDWLLFVHYGGPDCRRQLFIDERGTTGDLGEIWIRCECGRERCMHEATTLEMHSLGFCNGSRPWLGPDTREECQEVNRLLIRTASNAYFSQSMSVISLPEQENRVARAVSEVWEHHLQYVESMGDLQKDRERKPPVRTALDGLTDDQVFAEIQARRGPAPRPQSKPVKLAEIEVLAGAADESGHDLPDGDFYARTVPPATWDAPWMAPVERVVLVHRLREVTAQVGFTRFEPAAPDAQGELDLNVQRAPLSLETKWLPAVENRGEGVFLHFRATAIEAWLPRAAAERGRRLLRGFEAWRGDHPGTRREFPGVAYVMLHTLSHLLLTSIALECGYPASSLRERVYAGEGGFGILLYTAGSDAEGTLGGLVAEGRRVHHHLRQALELGRLCSNDPVCAQHDPADENERRFLAGAACHGCLLISETSCETYNDFLDRALVVPTVGDEGAAFFEG